MRENRDNYEVNDTPEGQELTLLKAKLFTHNDLDGVGCAIVGKRAFPTIDVDYCSYEEINVKVQEFLKERVEDFDVVFITDISVNAQVAELIEAKYGDKFQLLDHHDTAKFLNKYGWAFVDEKETNPSTTQQQDSSGTSMFANFLVQNKLLSISKYAEMYDFVEHVRCYDSWNWHNLQPRNLVAKQLNDLLKLRGRYKFLDRFVGNPEMLFTSVERALLEEEDNRIQRYIKQKGKELLAIEVDGYRVGFVFAENYQSELGNVLAEQNPDLDFIIMADLGRGTFSYRGTRDDIHLGEYAKTKGGGGHPKASGSPITSDLKEKVLSVLLGR